MFLARNLVSTSKTLSTTLRTFSSTAHNMGKLDGKVAIVTASTEGIGFACARRLAQDGASVMISSRNETKVTDALQTLKSEGLIVSGMVCHVAKDDHRKKLVEQTVKEFGGLDILVSNAACSPHFGHILDISEAAWDKLFDTNVKASFLLAKESVPHMRKRGKGNIIFMTSIAAYQTMPLIAPYGITKTALLGLTHALSDCLAMENIRVNGVAPGTIKTKFSEPLWKTSGITPRDAKIPMDRWGTSEDCAGVVSFLASDDSAYVTGETIVVAGGMQSKL